MRAPASTRRIEDRNPRPVAGSWVKIESKSNPGSFYEYHSLTRETRWVQGPSAQAAASKSTIVGRAALGSTDMSVRLFEVASSWPFTNAASQFAALCPC